MEAKRSSRMNIKHIYTWTLYNVTGKFLGGSAELGSTM